MISWLGCISSRRALLIAAAMATLLSVGVSTASAQGTLDQSVTGGSVGGVGPNGSTLLAQTFTAGITGVLSQVDLQLSTYNGPPPLSVDIENVDANGHPSGTVLAATTVTTSSVPGSQSTWVSLPFSDGPFVVAGTRYAIVLSKPLGAGFWIAEYTGPYSGGDVQLSPSIGSTWLEIPQASLLFRTYVERIGKEQCKSGGWHNFPQFRNQGNCVSFVAAHG
jgi:hypothetical protein